MKKNPFIIDTLLPTTSYDTIYTDMDSTLVLWAFGAINNNLLEFFRQQKEQGKKIVILTRAPNPDWVLPMAGIDPAFFNEVISVLDTPKSQYIPRGSAAIFIDDKEREREDVIANANILVFDPNSLWFRKMDSFPPKMRTPLETKIEGLKQELIDMQARINSANLELKNFARITKHYFDGVQDCSVIDMNSAMAGNYEAMLKKKLMEQEF